MIKSPVVNRAIFIYSLAAIDELTTLDGINHFHIAHNKPRLPSPSPEKKTLCLSVVFNFSWIDCNTREKLKTMFMHIWKWWIRDLGLRRFTVLGTRERGQVLSTELECRSFEKHCFINNYKCTVHHDGPPVPHPLMNFRGPKPLTFKMRPSAQTFLWKRVLFAWKWKIICISKAVHLTSFWYRGSGKLKIGLLTFVVVFPGKTTRGDFTKPTWRIYERH